MPKNFDLEAQYDANLNRRETACQWAEAELGYLLERESGHYLEQIPNQPEPAANGLEQFIPTMLGAIARDKYNDPYRAYEVAKTIVEYVVAGTFKGEHSRSTLTLPGGTRYNNVRVRDTGIQIGIFHTTHEPTGTFKKAKRFGESSIKRNEDTMRLLGALGTTLGTEQDISLDFVNNLPLNDQPIAIAELVTGDQVFATLHRATHDIDIIVRPADAQRQKVA